MATPDREAELARLVRSHEHWRAKSVFNLLPSENALSPTARKYLASDLAGRYTLPHAAPPGEAGATNDYGGTRFTDQIERLGNESAARLFHGRFATIRPLSGHLAAMSALVPLLPRGSKILAIPPDRGGYDGYAPDYLPKMFGWEVRPIPAEGPGGSVLADAAIAEIHREKPSAVLLGQSLFLFPYPLREIAEAAHAEDSIVLYDGSHVLGLIAGGQFQDPLNEGADILYGSTHKSLPGPQGGLLVTDREDLFGRIDPSLTWRVFDNAHWNRIAALTQTLLELERFGPSYAKTVVQNAQALGQALEERGLSMVAAHDGFTRSHQVHVDRMALKEKWHLATSTLARRWERDRLITDLIGRLGTAEVARLGLTPTEMPKLAELLMRSGLRKERVGSEVLAFRRSFPSLSFV